MRFHNSTWKQRSPEIQAAALQTSTGLAFLATGRAKSGGWGGHWHSLAGRASPGAQQKQGVRSNHGKPQEGVLSYHTTFNTRRPLLHKTNNPSLTRSQTIIALSNVLKT